MRKHIKEDNLTFSDRNPLLDEMFGSKEGKRIIREVMVGNLPTFEWKGKTYETKTDL